MASAGTIRIEGAPTAASLVLWLAICAIHAVAAPLDAEVCERLQQEQVDLTRAGVKQDMAKDPTWAAANLTQDKLNRIQRLIEVEEQLAFRCLQAKPEKAAAKAKSPAPKAPSTTDKKTEAKAEPPAGKAAASRVARPKVNDAYVPPAKSQELPWSGEPAQQ